MKCEEECILESTLRCVNWFDCPERCVVVGIILARLFTRGENLKIVAICGSMKFENEMKKIAFDLETKHNMCVLQCVYNEEKSKLSEKEIAALNSAHFRKIELSDAIYLVNLNGYIGEQVKKEIDFAQTHGKKVIFHTDFYELTGNIFNS